MTYLHKLARRLAGDVPALTCLTLVAGACAPGEERDFLSPNPGTPAPIVSLSVSPRIGSLRPNESIRFTAVATDSRGKAVNAVVDWSASGGTVTPDGTFVSGEKGIFQVAARLRSQPQIGDSAQVSVFVSPTDILLVTVSPDSAEVLEGEALKLQAEARQADGTTVQSPALVWTADGGRVDGDGWFTAEAPGSYRVSATASDGPQGAAIVLVRRNPHWLVSLAVTPKVASLAAGQSRRFSVLAQWSDGSSRSPRLVWSSTGGAIDHTGQYTAGSAAGTYRVVVREEGSAVGDTAVVSVTEPVITGLRVLPGTATLEPGASQQFTASATLSDGSTRAVGASWQATGGSITAGGLYTAGPAGGTYTVRAAVTGTAWTDTASVTVRVPGATLSRIVLNPSSASVPAGAERQFTATALWSDGTTAAAAVSWSATGGTISAAGLYRAGTQQGSYRVIATGQGGKADTSVVTVTPPVLASLTVSPPSVSLAPGAQRQFSASGTWSDGSGATPAVVWTATGGSISAGGLYTAGSEAGTYTVIGRQSGGPVADTAFVTVEPPAPTLLALQVAPATVALAPGGVQQLTVRGVWSNGGSSAPPVTWEAHGGTITAGGTYTAGVASGSWNVIARQQGGSLADTARVTVSASAPTLTALSVAPKTTTLLPNGSRQFTVRGTWSDGSTATPSVSWSATGGTVTNGGLYVAPGTAGTYRVVAAQLGGGKADTAVVTVEAAATLVALDARPDSAAVNPGQTVQFSAVGTYSNGGSGTPAVEWSAAGGTVSPGGQFTAGPAGGTFRVVAASGGLSDTSWVRVTGDPLVTRFSVSPKSVTVQAGATQQFTAAATWSDGVSRPVTVTYTATGGTITNGGLFSAGQAAGAFLVVASCTCGQADSAVVNVQAPPPVLQGITVSPKVATIVTGSTVQYAVTGAWSDGTARAVANATYTAAGGTISTGGAFTAGQEAGVFRVVAAAGSLRDTAEVTVTAGQAPSGVAELPRVWVNSDYPALSGQVRNVAAGGNLQAALDAATCGDEVLLAPGATFTGNFELRTKPCDGWIVIRTNTALPPPGTRMTPAESANLAKLMSPNVSAALATQPGARNYRVVGVEIGAAASVTINYGLVLFGDGSAAQNSLGQVPRNLILDRVYLHGHPQLNLSRCLGLNSAWSAVVDSYLSACHGKGFDSQAIGGWNGPGPYKIVNNYLEGAGENIMFGGADPAIAQLTPSDIEIRRNHFFKPPAWRGVWTVKNLFELKNAARVLVEANVLENNWVDAQAGAAVLLKSSNQDGGAPWSHTSDVAFRYNVLRNSPVALVVAACPEANPVAQPVTRIDIRDNLFENIGSFNGTSGSYFGQLLNDRCGLTDVLIQHNTATLSVTTSTLILAGGQGDRLRLLDNLWVLGPYGIKGDGVGSGTSALTTFFRSWEVRGNAFVGITTTSYPTGNFFVSDPLGASGLTGTDGRPPGADLATVNTMVRGVN